MYKRQALNRARLLAKGQAKRVFIRTFGRFDVFIDEKLVKFSNAKSKELLALCVDLSLIHISFAPPFCPCPDRACSSFPWC